MYRTDQARTILQERGITSAQADVLRRAARKYADSFGYSQVLHDGRVNTYSIRQDTLDKLQLLGLIRKEYVQNDLAERERVTAHSNATITAVMSAASHVAPLEMSNHGLPFWKETMKSLQHANECLKALDEKCLRITPLGREVAAEWKKAIGATEE